MKVLMFGWEFPPHISGGLGTACYGLTKSLAELGDTEITFVVPKSFGDEETTDFELVSADDVALFNLITEDPESTKEFTKISVRSDIIPYVTPEEFWTLKKGIQKPGTRFVPTDEQGHVRFSGAYGPDLYREIRNYSTVAGVIAGQKEHDVIHAHDWLSFPAGIEASRVSGKPLVVHVHATDFDRSGGNISSRIYNIEREGMEFAEKVITVSNLTRQTVIEKYNIPPEKVTTIYNASAPPPRKRNPGRTERTSAKTVTFLGRITLQKGPEYFVEAASLVLRHIPDATFVMAGSGDLLNDTIEHAARLGITDRFHFTGFLEADEVNHLLDISDVLVMPSVSEPFGIVPLEAMQAGVPVIISKQSGVAEIIDYAYKIDFWDTYSMANAIYGFLQYPALWKMFARHGRVEAENLHWKDSAGKVRLMYEDIIGKQPAPESKIRYHSARHPENHAPHKNQPAGKRSTHSNHIKPGS